MFKKEIYIKRREQLRQQLQSQSGIVLFLGNKETPFEGPYNFQPFRQDSSFLYFCELDAPELAMMMDLDSGETCLFGNNKTADEVIWSGLSPDVEDYAAKAGIKHSGRYPQLAARVQQAQTARRPLHILPPYQGEVINELQALLSLNREGLRAYVSEALIKAIVPLRSLKDEFEIKEMEQAAKIAHKMHTTAMIMTMPGAYEQDIKGVIEGIAVSMGGMLCFQPTLSMRGDILHNPRYSNTLEKGRMVVIDAGAESTNHYASDFTRSIPVGRSFTRMQKSLYEIVLKANQDIIAAIKPGVPYLDLHKKAALIITQGLKDLGLMKGDPEEAVAEGAHALFFPHGLGHMIGLDTHDMESYGEDYVGYTEEIQRSHQFGLAYLRLAKPLEAGFVVTVEPGIYFIDALIERWKQEKKFDAFINYDQVGLYQSVGGIRIEDEVLVTDSGSRVLGKPIPKTVKEIESF